MPLYDYHCKACEHIFEKQLKISEMDTPIDAPCPKCKKENEMERIIGRPGFGDPVGLGLRKPGQGWTDWLNLLKKQTPGAANFNTFR